MTTSRLIDELLLKGFRIESLSKYGIYQIHWPDGYPKTTMHAVTPTPSEVVGEVRMREILDIAEEYLEELENLGPELSSKVPEPTHGSDGYIECPYCEKQLFFWSSDYDDGDDEVETCDFCNQKFLLHVEISVNYTATPIKKQRTA